MCGLAEHALMKALTLAGLVFSIATLAVAKPPAAGIATGTCSVNSEAPAKLAFASAFVDEKDSAKPTVLILSDIKLPTEAWTSEFDVMRFKTPFSGAIFYISSDNPNTRVEFYWKGKQSAVSGYFTMKLDQAKGKELTGTVVTDTQKAGDPHVDATFHAVLK